MRMYLSETTESEKHLCETCLLFESERGDKVLNSDDVFGSLETQIKFVKIFKVIARKWKMILEIDANPSRWALLAP